MHFSRFSNIQRNFLIFLATRLEFNVSRCIGGLRETVQKDATVKFSGQLDYAIGCRWNGNHLLGIGGGCAKDGHSSSIDNELGSDYQWTIAGHFYNWYFHAMDRFNGNVRQKKIAIYITFLLFTQKLYALMIECIGWWTFWRSSNVMGQFECTMGNCIWCNHIRSQGNVHS